jgi:SSS family solute:Na+ symporter
MTLIHFIVLAYLVLIVAFIAVSGRGNKTFKDFALGDKGGLPLPIVIGTLFSSIVGGATMVGYIGQYKDLGLQWALLPFVCFFLAGPLMAFFLASRVRRLNQCTTGDLFYLRYGKAARIASAVVTALTELICVIGMLATFIVVTRDFLGLNYHVALWGGVLLFAFTAMCGGLKGVAWTDTVQALLIISAVATVAVLSFVKLQAAGGFAALPVGHLNPFTEKIPWSIMIGIILSVIGMSMASQSLSTQRINACRTTDAAKIGFLITLLLVGAFMIFGIGTIGISASVITAPGVRDNNVVTEILKQMPEFVAAIYSSAIIASVLTTGNSCILSASISFVDIFSGIKKVSEEKKVALARLFIAGGTIAAALCVLISESVITWILFAYVMFAILAIPLFGGLLFKRATPLSGLLSIAFGAGAAVIWGLLGQPWGLHPIYASLLFNIIGFVAGFLSSKKSTPEQLRAVDIFRKGNTTLQPKLSPSLGKQQH